MEPITTALAGKAVIGLLGKAAVKAAFIAKMAGLKSFLAATIGQQAAGVSVGILAAAATAAYWERNVKGNTDQDAIDAAMAKGVSWDIAQGIVKWLARS